MINDQLCLLPPFLEPYTVRLLSSGWEGPPRPFPRRFVTFMIVLVALLAIFPVYSRLKQAAAPIPPGVVVGGLALSDMKDLTQIRNHIEGAYSGPIGVSFGEKKLALRPEDVDFRLDVDHMLAEARQYVDGPVFVEIAARYVVGVEQRRHDVPTAYMVDVDKLRAWLDGVAAQYNSAPQRARVVGPAASDVGVVVDDAATDAAATPEGPDPTLDEWRWVVGAPGYTLDIEASIPTIVAALARPDGREANLVLIETPPPPPAMEDLARVLNTQTLQFPGFAAIYVHDLMAGDTTPESEASVDSDVSFSGMSTLKIGLAAAVMRKLANGVAADDADSQEIGLLLDYALGESNNFAANQLLAFLGDGDVNAGTRAFTEFMRSLGFTSTYMQSGYDIQTQLPQIPTPGNSQTEWETDPDTNLQSTPREMGRILSAIYACTQGTGPLLATYPDAFTPDECWQILFYMAHDQFREMVWAGLPSPDVQWIVHKHGFAFESHSDVALVWGPAGPYVISIFLYRQGWMDWATSNSTMQKVSRITWKFFEFKREQELVQNRAAPAPPARPELPPPPGYQEIYMAPESAP